uniref:Uncharacterized protein n=1 Tax=Anguilla anguilla TaxID=7936 RepID=A0A0E9SL45_ANGAN
MISTIKLGGCSVPDCFHSLRLKGISSVTKEGFIWLECSDREDHSVIKICRVLPLVLYKW